MTLKIFDYLGTLGHYNYRDYTPYITHRGKGHNKQAHKIIIRRNLKRIEVKDNE